MLHISGADYLPRSAKPDSGHCKTGDDTMLFRGVTRAAVFALTTTIAMATSFASFAGEMKPGFMIMETESGFEDAVGDLENAIINEGLVIDYKGMVGDMLMRTGDTVGAKSPYSNAVYMQFCSAKHTHAAVAADPKNIAICPYVTFVYELADGSGVKIGYRRTEGAEGAASAAALAEIDTLLAGIMKSAAGGL